MIVMNMTFKAAEDIEVEEYGVVDKLRVAKNVLDTTNKLLEMIKNILSL